MKLGQVRFSVVAAHRLSKADRQNADSSAVSRKELLNGMILVRGPGTLDLWKLIAVAILDRVELESRALAAFLGEHA